MASEARYEDLAPGAASLGEHVVGARTRHVLAGRPTPLCVDSEVGMSGAAGPRGYQQGQQHGRLAAEDDDQAMTAVAQLVPGYAAELEALSRGGHAL